MEQAPAVFSIANFTHPTFEWDFFDLSVKIVAKMFADRLKSVGLAPKVLIATVMHKLISQI